MENVTFQRIILTYYTEAFLSIDSALDLVKTHRNDLETVVDAINSALNLSSSMVMIALLSLFIILDIFISSNFEK